MEDSIHKYPIIRPAISSAGIYFFTTDSGLQYEVRFGRRQDNILHATIVFGVINDEFEGEEYVVTNRGEVFKVMNTIVDIIKIFIEEHPKIMTYEFNGIPKEGEPENKDSQRSNLYKRYLPKIFDVNQWTFKFQGNSAWVNRKTRL